MNTYRSLTPGDQRIFTSTTPLDETPQGFSRLTPVYHVQVAASKAEADYSVTHQGRTQHYKFSSLRGKTAHKAGGRVVRTMNPSAVTCPDCLSVLKIETFDLNQEIQKVKQEQLEKQQAIEAMQDGVQVGDSSDVV